MKTIKGFSETLEFEPSSRLTVCSVDYIGCIGYGSRLLLKIGTKYPSNHEFHPESVPNISRERERTERRKEEEETHTAHSVTHTHTHVG